MFHGRLGGQSVYQSDKECAGKVTPASLRCLLVSVLSMGPDSRRCYYRTGLPDSNGNARISKNR